jgi:hypothetical protein
MKKAIAAAGVLVLAITLSACSLIPLPTPGGQQEREPRSAETAEPQITEVPTLYIDDRPGFQPMIDHITGMYDRYLAEFQSGSITNYFPDGYDESYAKDFLYILADKKGATLFMGSQSSTSAADLDLTIKSFVHDADVVEQKFLAHQDLGVTISIKRGDGTSYESDGTFDGSGAAVAPAADAELFASSFDARIGADGTYRDAIDELTNAFGMFASYDYPRIYDLCPVETVIGDVNTAAAYCQLDPLLVYVNPDQAEYARGMTDGSMIDVIKHELSHARIFDLCGTMAPPVAGANYEGVTNSYAALFLGADRDVLYTGGQEFPQYQMSSDTDNAAQLIHDGNCE